jgi:hypothetical protein
MGPGQIQDRINADRDGDKTAGDDVEALRKAMEARRKRLTELDLSDVLSEHPEIFLKSFGQVPGE